jgi:hypothetical protein
MIWLMKQQTDSIEWLMANGGQESSLTIAGWYPLSFDWEIKTLYTRQAELHKIKIILGIRQGQRSGHHPEMLFDQLPTALLSNDKYVQEKFSPYLSGFAKVLVETGLIYNNRRFNKFGKSVLLVPTPEVYYNKPGDVTEGKHIAIIADKFCISSELHHRLSFYVRDVVFVPFNPQLIIPPPSSADFSNFFKNRPKSQGIVVENKLLQFILSSLEKFKSDFSEKLGAVLLDCDPNYGYMIVALKISPVIDKNLIEIGDFEFSNFAEIEENKLYGEAEFLSQQQFRMVIKRVIQKLVKDDLVKSLVGPSGLHIAYAFHDEDINWISEIER